MISLLNEKFTPASLPRICAPRKALLSLFSRAARERFVYMHAPARSGKTVSTLLWLSDCGMEKIWIGLDAYDNSPSVFYKLLASGIGSTQPGNKNVLGILLSPTFSLSPVEHMVRLLSELHPSEKKCALVLDDMHLITNGDIIQSLPVVLKRLPRSFLVIILSQNALPQEFKDVIKNESASVIGGESLNFSPNELQQYFKSLGRDLSPEEVEFAHMVTAGRPMKVNAIIQSRNLIPNRNGHSFDEYLKDYIWSQCDNRMRDFLLKTSVADEFTVELANLLTGRDDSDQALRSLCAQNSLIISAGSDVFRYHQLFHDFLRTLAFETSLKAKPLNTIIARYYLKNGEQLTARRYALKSGDPHIIMHSIYHFSRYTNPSFAEYIAFSQALSSEVLSQEVCDQYPIIYLSHVYVAFLSGDSQSFESYLDMIYPRLDVIARDFPQFLETVILAISLDYRIPFLKQIALYDSLPAIAHKSDKPGGASLTLQMPFLHRSNRDYHELSHDENMLVSLEATFAVLLREHYRVTRPCLLCGFSLEKNRLEAALAHAMQACRAAESETSPEFMFAANMHLAAVYCAMFDEQRQNTTLIRIEKGIKERGAHYLEDNFFAFKTRVALMNGDKGAAELWLKNDHVIEDESLPLFRIFQHFTTVRAHIVLASPEKAMKAILKLSRLAEDFRRPTDLAEANVLKAYLEWALNRRKEAVATLEEALCEMQKLGYIRVIADEGAAIEPLLARISAKVNREDYRGPLERGYVTAVMLAARSISKKRRGIAVNMKHAQKPAKLSKRQRLMIELLAQGYGGRQIAEITGLKLPTVKGHIQLAYGKLNVNNAMDAVLKARELKIIS
jgi:LuxR family maltose regulon positive regulatory protein